MTREAVRTSAQKIGYLEKQNCICHTTIRFSSQKLLSVHVVKKNAFLTGQIKTKCAIFRENSLFQSYVQHTHTQTNKPLILCQLDAVCLFVSWCFECSQPQRSTSALRETFIKRYVVEWTNKAEIRPEEQSEKAESCRENLWNKIQVKGP